MAQHFSLGIQYSNMKLRIFKPATSLFQILLVVSLAFVSCPVRAQILSGSIVNYEESAPTGLVFGDGAHSVTLWWSINDPDSSGYFYTTADTQVAIATNVSSPSDILDASRFAFTTNFPNTYYIGPVFDVATTGGINSYIVLRNIQNGYYGVVRIDDIFSYPAPIDNGWTTSLSGLNATWWFQSNGTPLFQINTTPVEPPILSIQPTTNGVMLFWPTSATSYHLLQNTNLASTSWVSNTNSIILANGTNQVTISPKAGSLFLS